MELTLKSPPWWSWFSLLGLDVPFAAVVWAYALSRVNHVVFHFSILYQFLFVSVWCLNILSRIIRLHHFHDGQNHFAVDECLLFTQRHIFPFLFIVLVSGVASLWLMFFEVGYWIFWYAAVPMFLLCLATLVAMGMPPLDASRREFSVRSAIALFLVALAFAGGAGIPPYFYDFDHPPFLVTFEHFSWYLVAFLMLSAFARRRWVEEYSEDEEESARFSVFWLILLCVYEYFCLKTAVDSSYVDMWIYLALAVAGVLLFVLDRLGVGRPPLLLKTLSWLALIVPVLFASGFVSHS